MLQRERNASPEDLQEFSAMSVSRCGESSYRVTERNHSQSVSRRNSSGTAKQDNSPGWDLHRPPLSKEGAGR